MLWLFYILFTKIINMGSDFNNKLNSFDPITLSQMNSGASFLERIDTKYILTEKDFNDIIVDLEKDFYILNIGWKSMFKYDSVYMDTEAYDFYKQHQNNEKSRTKIRTRLYKDSDMAFFEYKQKVNWLTRKFRYLFPSEEHGKMTKGKTRFFEWVYSSFYWKLPEKVFPSIRSEYNRLTLCAKDSWERLTVDFDIKLTDLRNENKPQISLNNVVIIESKSMNKNCISKDIMKKNKIKKSYNCSKYCIWLLYNNTVLEHWLFEKTMKKIEKLRNK